jgi:hypothetical protein
MSILTYTTFDEPVPYKNLKIYPVTVRDYMLFNAFSECLTLDKNSIPDAKIISMTELEYIYYATEKENKPYLFWFDRLLALSLKDDESFKDFEKSIFRYKYNEQHNPFFVIGNTEYDSKDFIDIKNIICQQNLVDIPDENISKEVRDSLEEARKYKNRGSKPATLEDYMIALSTVTGWELDYIYSMTIRKFIKSIERLNNLIHYKIYMTASMSGFVEFKDKSAIKHWLENLDEEDKYKDVALDLEAIQKKLNFEDAKKEASSRQK